MAKRYQGENHEPDALRWKALMESKEYDAAESLAFSRCGCRVSHPNWWLDRKPVECVHTECQIARGEKHPIVLFNRTFHGEMTSGWLRFSTSDPVGRKRVAALYWAQKKVGRFDIMSAVALAVAP